MPDLQTASVGRPLPADYELLLKLVGELHGFHDKGRMRAWLLDEALPALVPSDWLSYNEVDLVEPQNTLSVLKPESPAFFQKLFPRFQELAFQHPLIVRQMQSDNFPVHKISDFLSQTDYHKLELYREVYRPLGVEYQIAATIRLAPGQVTAFAFSRRKGDYTERDRAVLELIRPHLVVAFNNLNLSRSQAAKLRDAELALNEISSATLVVDSGGKILYHTGPAREWIGATDPGSLPAPVARWLNAGFKSHKPEPFLWQHNSAEIHIRAVPTSSAERRLLVLSKKEAASPASSSSAANLLSRRQLEVARWIREGKTNADIARIMGISPRTVQKHVEHIFEKLGVETRVAVATKLIG